MEAAHLHRRPHKIRRTGRHTTPSQVEKVAETAVKVAPAVAITGALVALPTAANASVRTPAKATAVTEQVQQAQTTAARHAAQSVTTTYTVRSGDTLSLISRHFYGTTSKWNWIYQANRSKISNPNSIFVGEKLTIPNHAPVPTAYHPKHAKKPVTTTLSTSHKKVTNGIYSCSNLESLWVQAGGARSKAFIAAEIAMAESGGRQYAHSPTNDFGLWQINGVHGPSMATYDAMGNAKAAIAISSNGTNWRPWTTYTSGAYHGRC